MVRTPLAVVSLVLALLPALASAQAYGRLFGKVVDSEGEPLADVEVKLEIAGTDTVIETTTDKKGKFKLAVVDATKLLTLRLSKPGYQARAEDVKIPIGQIIQGQWGLEKEGAGSALGFSEKVEGTRKAVDTFNEGVTAYNSGNKAEAMAKFEEARELDPSIKEAHEILSSMYIEVNRFDDAAAAAQALLAIQPDSRVALETQFSVAENRGELAAIKELANRLIEFYPGSSTARIAFNAGIATARSGDDAGAGAFFAAAVEMEPELMPAKVGLARSLYQTGKHDEAFALTDAIIEKDPGNATAWNIRYEVYRLRGDKAKADEAYGMAFAANPERAAESMYEDGRIAWESGNAERAVTVLSRLLELAPDHPRAHYLLGLAAVSSGNIAEAKRLLSRFLELAPNDSEAGTAREMLRQL